MTTEQKFDCVFCHENFNDKETLQIHFRKHGDPNFDLTTKIVTNRTQNDPEKVVKIGEDIEMVGCDVCEEVFPTISKAITHKHKAHPDHVAKYFCPFCGKQFTMKHLLNKHLQSNHETEVPSGTYNFNCDMCNVTFNVPSAMLYHNKFFHRQDTDIPTIGKSKKVKLYSHEILHIYYCSFCGEEFNNKVNLNKHRSDDHNDENQSPNEVLKCPLCEAVFYHLDAYELHLTFHSSEDMYSEKNALVDQITEFSLETVAPILETVVEEDQATQPEEESSYMNTDPEEMTNFLQLLMGDEANNVAMEKVKHKKHKKHKKSKKASITLDEFLNMNKDVFGDGLGDVQGIEEVPTQVVLKKYKAQNRNETKMMNADLAKLKKQGIIVKSNSKNKALVKNVNTNASKHQNISGVSDATKQKANVSQNSPDDILSKLLNQGNSQIKIVKKSVPQNNLTEDEDMESVTSDAINNQSEENRNLSLTEKCDTNKVLISEETPLVLCKINAHSNASNLIGEIQSEFNENYNKFPIRNIDFDDKEILVDGKQLTSECNQPNVTESKERSNSTLECVTNTSDDSTTNYNLENNLKSTDETQQIFVENPAEKEVSNNVDVHKLNIENNNEENEASTNKTISALKHLSHLITVKPLANQSKDSIKSSNINEENTPKEYNNETHVGYSSPKRISAERKIPLIIPLNYSGPITVNPPKDSPTSISRAKKSEIENKVDFTNGQENYKNLEGKNSRTTSVQNIIEMKELKVSLVPLSQSICNKYLSKNLNLKNSNYSTSEQVEEETNANDDCSKETPNKDILKRFPHVTAKPLTTPKNVNQQVSVKSQQTSLTLVKNIPTTKFSKGIDQELEVYNIDDSDDDTEGDSLKIATEAKQSCKVTADVLKNLSTRNITVKSAETKIHPNTSKAIKLETNSTRSDCYSESYTQIKQSKEIQKSINLQNKLKTLGNITVKSRNSSPNVYNKDQKAFEDDRQENESESDSENIGKVKITEVNEDYTSDNDLHDSHSNAVIESPNDSNSENEDNQKDLNEDLPDFENKIKTNTVKKTEVAVLKKAIPNLDNINKAITIKSLNSKNIEQISNVASNKEVLADTCNTNHEMAVKPYRANVPPQNEQPNVIKNNQQAGGSMNQCSSNQKVNTASNQVNTVKTVNTVKRFQSQTVIEEITTTVTKTIRTVNSSTNEVMQSCSQNTPKSTNRPLKIINKQPGKELQGTPVRHASPTVGTKIRNSVPICRTPNISTIRPSNQLVPVRPVFNRPRCPIPSTSAVRIVTPPRFSPQKPAIGKLKISPHALNQTNKRNSEEAFGNFSSLKRPKDTIISTPDLPDFSDDDTPEQYMSTSQSRSDFSSVTKSVKGKGMITATQTRSEVSTSSQQQITKGTATQMRSEVCMSSQQQLSKLSNVSGLKVVKTSTKQATHMEEKCEISPGKRNTLEALEKLQKIGLLVKKPRIEEYEANSYSESDDEFGEK